MFLPAECCHMSVPQGPGDLLPLAPRWLPDQTQAVNTHVKAHHVFKIQQQQKIWSCKGSLKH